METLKNFLVIGEDSIQGISIMLYAGIYNDAYNEAEKKGWSNIIIRQVMNQNNKGIIYEY